MTDSLEKIKRRRTVVRTTVTKMVNQLEGHFNEQNVDYDKIEELADQLPAKAETLKELDLLVEARLELKDYDAEVISAEEYQDKIALAVIRARKMLRIKKEEVEKINRISSVERNFSTWRENTAVKLPKLNIQKYYGDYTQYSNFWNTFKVAIHDNESLSDIEKMNYLYSYLGGNALSAVAGFALSESNYSAALKILEDRFGKKDIIVNSHMNKLLNLTPIFKSSDTFKLKKLHDEIETNVRSLTSLGVESKSYSNMLIAVVLRILPNNLTLEYNRKYGEDVSHLDIYTLLGFIQKEIQSRERTYQLNYAEKSRMPDEMNKTKFKSKNSYFNMKTEPTTLSTHEFMAPVGEKPPTEMCVFCKKVHDSGSCETYSVEEKRNILKTQGRCYLCLGSRHRIRECRSRLNCKHCRRKHNEAICYKLNSPIKKVLGNDNETGKEEAIVSTVSHSTSNKIFLQTCCARVKTNNEELITRILLDNGSMRSFVTQAVVNKLKLDTIRKEKLSVFTFGNKSPIEKSYDVVKLRLEHRYFPDQRVEVEVLVTDQISGTDIPPPELNDLSENKQLKSLILADSPECQEPISLLIGADFYYNIVTGNIKHLSRNLVTVETIFGWCLQGRKSDNHQFLTLSVIVGEDTISEQIKKFWDLDHLGLIKDGQNSNPFEHEIMKQFESDLKYENHRYKVRLPWKRDAQNLDDNKEIAKQRFFRLRKRLQRNPDLFIKYSEVLQDYLKQGIIEIVPDSKKVEDHLATFYLPHKEIIREDRSTSKLRIVFDASSHAKGTPSLNDYLHVGPNLYPDIFEILLKFRFKPIVFTTDIKQAFLQILIHEKDRNVSRFLFTDNPTDESLAPLIYRFTRVLFGVNSSPFLLAATIKHHLKKYYEMYPTTVEFLNENIYVDDIIGSHQTVEQALATTLESIHIFKEASMELHKWRTNSKSLYESWEKEGLISSNNTEVFGKENHPFKVLGLAWDNSKDLLYFDIQSLLSFLSRRIDTKRFLLQVLGRIFDPIGFLGPFTLRIKCLMQKVWSLGIDWDETLPEDLSLDWKNWCKEVPQLQEFSVPRYYFSNSLEFEHLELHCFSDASMKAYGTVIYLRVITRSQQIHTVFVTSKNRVAPLKSLTLPKLELMGALLSAKLSDNVLKALKIKIPRLFWTDSKITYFWIRGSPEKFKPFVKNRVEEIHGLTSPSDWFHCPGAVNPADLVSRGANISKVINDPIWLQGPDWLRLTPEFWPKSNNEEIIDKYELEYRKKFENIVQGECVVETPEYLMDISKFSNLEKLLRITSWIRRFILKLNKSNNIRGTLVTTEIQEAENYWIRVEQKNSFAEEFTSLKENNTVKKDSSLYSFVPFLDENEIMRIGGRLEFSNLSEGEKHPIILAKHSWLTVLVVRRAHEKTMHGGTATTLAKVRSCFWIPKGRQLVKSVIKNCVICRKYLARPINQMTAPLPGDRINETPPFSVCGIDFAGPIYVKNFKEIQKSYIVLFTCAVTRALQLELVTDMSTNSFLLAFRRFLARRGNCRIIYSDNAMTFKKGKKEIENFSDILSDNMFQNFVAKERIIWKNIIERAAWWGGFYERLVKSVKECIRKVVGKALLTHEEMSTLLVEVETVLNLRPLTYVYSENEEPQPLTPMHFLNFGQATPTYPISFTEIINSGSKRSSLIKRKQYQVLLLRQLWSKWKQEYLLALRSAHSRKNPESRTELKVGDIVLIEDNSKNKLHWKLGKIEKSFPGRDNKIRSYEIKTGKGNLKRAAQHLYPLEL